MLKQAQAIGASQRGAGLESIVDPLGLGHAEARATPVSREEAERIKSALTDLREDPAGDVASATQLVRYLRGDLIASALSPHGDVDIDEDLLINWLGAAEVMPLGAGQGVDLKNELVRLATHQPRPDDVLALLRDGPDELYERGRTKLHMVRDSIAFAREHLDGLPLDASGVDALQRSANELLRFDPREPSYSHKQLLAALGMMVVNESVGLIDV
jgi:hypothetical protein